MAKQHQVWRAYFDHYLSEATRSPVCVDAAQVVAQARAFADGVILELGKHGGEAGLAPAFGAAAGTQGPLPRPAGKSFGQLGYERFSEVYSWDSEDGVGLPPWGELDAAKKTQWEAAAEAIRAA